MMDTSEDDIGLEYLLYQCDRLQEENDNLRSFILRLADRIYLAHEVIGKLAEKKEMRKLP